MSGHQNPYVGLRPFFLQDSLHFFGREAQTAELLSVLHEHRFLGVVGASGSGKSSLVRAGLLPALIGGFLVGDRDRWQLVQIKPGDTPMRNLAAGLLAAASETPPSDAEIAAFEATIRDEQADAIIAFVKARLTPRESLFLLVDQFEEIFPFRRAGEDERAEATDFVSLLMALAEESADVPVFVALTMRTDFLGECDLFYGLPEIMNRGQYLVPRLTRQQLRLAIEGPAMLTGARIAPRLLDLLLNKLGDREDRLPVIQHALLRTWDAWNASGATGPIEVAHFEEAGGLENALNLDAEAAIAEVTAELPAVDDSVVAKIFKALTETDIGHRAIRRPARVSQLMAASGADRATVDAVIRCFSHKHRNFVHADGWPNAPDPRVDISHESLIRQWQRLREWVDDEREMRDHFTALVVRARSAQKYGVMLQGNELKSADAWWKSATPSSAWAGRYADAADDFAVAEQVLTASKKARLRTTLSWYVSAAVVVAAIAGALTYVQRKQARTEADTELLRDMENHAISLLDRDPESAIAAGLIAAEAHASLYPGTDLPIALEATLLRAWQESAVIKTQHLAFDGDADYAVLSRDSKVVLLGGAAAVDGESGVKAYDVATGRLIASRETPSLLDSCVGFSSDAGQLHLTADRISLRWLLATGDVEEVAEQIVERGRRMQGCWYSPDATTLAVITTAPDDVDWVLTLASVSAKRITKLRDIRLAAKAQELPVVRFSESGDAIAVAVQISQKETAVSVMEVRSGASIKRFKTENFVSDIVFSRENKLIATVENAYTFGLYLRRLDEDGPASILPNSAKADGYSALKFSPDGLSLAAANGETVTLWDLEAGFDIASFKGHQRAILGLAFEADDRIVTVGQDADIRYWRAGLPEKRAFLPRTDVASAVLSPSGSFVITADMAGDTTGWMVDQQTFPAKFDLPARFSLALSPDGRVLAAATTSTIDVVDVQSGRVVSTFDGGTGLVRLAFSPNGRRFAFANAEQLKVWTLPADMTQNFAQTQPLIITSKAVPGKFEEVVFSLDEEGRQLATIDDRSVFLWNATTGACEGRIDGQSPIYSVAYVPGGTEIATGDEVGRVRFWSLALALKTGCDESAAKKERIPPDRTLQEHRAEVMSITFARDASRFATASADRTAKVWDTTTGKVLLTFRHARPLSDAAFSSDGKLLMTVVDGQGVRLWDVPLRNEILPVAAARITRECLTKDERLRFFPNLPVDNPPCVTVK